MRDGPFHQTEESASDPELQKRSAYDELISMDPLVGELLLGVVSNGLYDFVSRGLGNPNDLSADDGIDRAVQEALSSFSDIKDLSSLLEADRLKHFLASPEIHYVMRQIYASEGEQLSGDAIRDEFRELWNARSATPAAHEPEVDQLFEVLVALCEQSLDRAIANGELTALEAKNTRRQTVLQDALLGIQQTVDILNNKSDIDVSAIDDFAEKYRSQIAAREGVITPPALDAARDFPIDDLYVPAQLAMLGTNPPKQFPYSDFANHLYRSVVLGNPGSGKSTLAKKLAADLATDHLTMSASPHSVVPFLVILRDFGSHKKDSPCSIVDFISLTSNSRYQVAPPAGAVEYLLATNRAVVIFDGLDELLDTSYRAEISGDVQSFGKLYPSVPLLVTSREVGYEQAPLPKSSFVTFRLSEFTDEDARAYAERWFGVGSDVTRTEANDQAARFMADSSNVADIRSNALMLGLMCNLYKGSGYIPRNRPDVYEACAEMLFDRWDRLRKIEVGLNIESLLKPTMQHLAFWIYQDADLQSGVTEDALVKEAASYLLNRRFDSIDEAELEARRFIEFCRGRAWVFTDTGTTSAGNRLYQFTHRTFLEFFAARHLIRTHSTPRQLLKVLKPRIAAKEWDVVAQLAFQLLERNVDGAADSLLRGLIPNQIKRPTNTQGNCIDFACRSLAFLVPTPPTVRSVTSIALDNAMVWTRKCAHPKKTDWATEDGDNAPIGSVLALIDVNPENYGPVEVSLLEGLSSYVHRSDTASYAAELALNFRGGHGVDEAGRKFADGLQAHFVDREIESLHDLAKIDMGVAQDLVRQGRLLPRDLVDQHGLQALFNHRLYWMFPKSGRVPIANIALGTVLWGIEGGMNLEEALGVLKEAAVPLESITPPWYEAKKVFGGSSWVFETWRQEHPAPSVLALSSLTSAQRFSLTAFAAAAVEEAMLFQEERGGPLGIADSIGRIADGGQIWSTVAPLLRAKLGLDPVDAGLDTLSELRLTKRNRQTFERWLSGVVSFVSLEPLPKSA
jgi:hypothetical protein